MPTRHEALEAALAYFGGDALAASAWVDKYALRDAEGRLLERDPDAMHARLAREFARAEAAYPPLPAEKRALLSELGQRLGVLDHDRILALLAGFRKVVPQGSVMAGLGDAHHLASLSNCVVLPPPFDSYGGILRTDEQLAQLCKRRCGVGFDLSTLRPAGMPVHNAARTSTGATGFMERYSSTVREVAQQGRRGALMLTMDVRHPDIIAFIESKQDLARVTGANISVRVSDAFMQAVEADAGWELRWPVEEEAPRMRRTVKARAVWDRLVACAHATAEPGVLFWDRQHRYSTSSVYPGFRNAGTNPCGEIAMQGGDSCRLMALNLMGFMREPFTAAARFDHEAFAEAAYLAQRLMDDLVDLELETIDRILAKIDADPEPESVKRVERELWRSLRDNGASGRRTGLGITALADALAALGHRYGDADSLAATGSIMRTKCRAEFECSIDMAIERGAFAVFDPAVESESEFVRMLRDEFPDVHARMMRYGRRNISLSTVAPTGTVSLLTRTSSGIEPVYMLGYTRRRKVVTGDPKAKVSFTDELGDQWEEFTVHHPRLLDWMRASGKQDRTLSPYAGATANDIDWYKRIRLQAVVQKYTTHSISSTINLPATATVEEVGGIYLEAWKAGLKGITVYRDGSRHGVLVPEKKGTPAEQHQHVSRPERLEADVLRFHNETEPWIAVVGMFDGRPYEIFTGRANGGFELPRWVTKGWVVKRRDNKRGKNIYDLEYADTDDFRVTVQGLSRTFNKEFWNYAILISGMLREGVPLPQVVDVVANLNLYDTTLNTWKNGVVRALQRYIPDGTSAAGRRCADCGDADGVYYEEGCLKCRSCGSSKCG